MQYITSDISIYNNTRQKITNNAASQKEVNWYHKTNNILNTLFSELIAHDHALKKFHQKNTLNILKSHCQAETEDLDGQIVFRGVMGKFSAPNNVFKNGFSPRLMDNPIYINDPNIQANSEGKLLSETIGWTSGLVSCSASFNMAMIYAARKGHEIYQSQQQSDKKDVVGYVYACAANQAISLAEHIHSDINNNAIDAYEIATSHMAPRKNPSKKKNHYKAIMTLLKTLKIELRVLMNIFQTVLKVHGKQKNRACLNLLDPSNLFLL